MALVTNDKPVYEAQDKRKVVDAGSLLDDSNPVVLRNPDAFRPVGPMADEPGYRSSAVSADPTRQAEGWEKAKPPLNHDVPAESSASASLPAEAPAKSK